MFARLGLGEENAVIAVAPDFSSALTYAGGILSGRLSAPIGVCVYADGEMIWQGPAQPVGATEGAFGFDALIPDPAGEAVITSRVLRVLCEDGRELPGSPLEAPYGDHLLGYVEAIKTTAENVLIGGWLIDRRSAAQPVRLGIWYDGALVQTAATGVSRTDLGVTGYDAPHGGFFVTIAKPDAFDHRKLRVLPGRAARPLALTENASLPDAEPPAPAPAPAQMACGVEAYIDHVSAAGVVSGWARSAELPAPVGIELWLDGECVGAASACAFRRDLLEAGLGHGHYGFECRIRAKARHGVLELRETGGQTMLARLTIAPGLLCEAPATPRTVESLLTRPDQWGMEDVARHIQALALDFNLSALGPSRFIARVYRFLLGRWPDPPEFDFYLNDLSQGVISATDVFRIVAGSEERKRSQVTPLSPYDPKFPFLPSNRQPYPSG
jgi:hypothetical protein